ncbi:hypothetical protein [Paraburkholderia sp. MM6662-R1]|uniref:hypothetical protein n=1 Tax=Paraburkholderia sp. MM6662-R1 TaxID=2991066 RepID=UPI003D1F0AC1
MLEHRTLLSLACDLVFLWGWFAVYERVVPNSGVRRIAGIAGWLSALVGYVELSASIFTRWEASYHFDAWAMPLDLFEKFGVLAVIAATALMVIANRGNGRHAATVN